jgi:hypothetical protein
LKGAIVFLVVFFILVFVTLGYVELPPGRMIYNLLNVPETDCPVLGIGATTLAISVFNGVVYGFIAWLIYTLVTGREKKDQTNVNVTVNVPERGKEEPKTTTQASF